MSKPKAILYTRVSSDQQVDNTSLDSQEKYGRKFCEQKDYELVKIFREEGESAKFKDRTKLTESLAYSSQKNSDIDFFIVYKYDRFSRSLENHIMIKATLARYGVRLLSITEPIDESPSGRLMENILASFAQFDNELRTERTIGGMKALIEKGYLPWKPPLGYKKDGKEVVADPLSFPFVTKAWKMYLTGNYTMTELVDYLNDRNVKTHTGKHITISTFSKLLRKVYYAGIIFSDKFDLRVKGRHPAMITEAEFYKVQEMLDGNKKGSSLGKHDVHPDFHLAKTLKCSNCSRVLSGCYSKGRSKYYGYYQCTNTKGCDNRNSFNKDKAEEIFSSL